MQLGVYSPSSSRPLAPEGGYLLLRGLAGHYFWMPACIIAARPKSKLTKWIET
jgi:hypothetical protein